MGKDVPYYQSIEAYNFRMNLPPPRYSGFDITSNNSLSIGKDHAFRLSFFQIILLKKGSNQPGYTLLFHLPNQIIEKIPEEETMGYYLSVEDSFYTTRLDEYPSLYDLPFFKHKSPPIDLSKTEALPLSDTMQLLSMEYHRPGIYKRTVIKSLLCTLLSYCIRLYGQSGAGDKGGRRPSRLSERFTELVRQRLGAAGGMKDLTAGKCADCLSVTPKHLSEVVKKDTGLTPTRYIQQTMATEAQKLLLTTSLQVKEIAIRLGFEDASYFSRLFRKMTGQSPDAYRRNRG